MLVLVLLSTDTQIINKQETTHQLTNNLQVSLYFYDDRIFASGIQLSI